MAGKCKREKSMDDERKTRTPDQWNLFLHERVCGIFEYWEEVKQELYILDVRPSDAVCLIQWQGGPKHKIPWFRASALHPSGRQAHLMDFVDACAVDPSMDPNHPNPAGGMYHGTPLRHLVTDMQLVNRYPHPLAFWVAQGIKVSRQMVDDRMRTDLGKQKGKLPGGGPSVEDHL